MATCCKQPSLWGPLNNNTGQMNLHKGTACHKQPVFLVPLGEPLKRFDCIRIKAALIKYIIETEHLTMLSKTMLMQLISALVNHTLAHWKAILQSEKSDKGISSIKSHGNNKWLYTAPCPSHKKNLTKTSI